MIIAEYDPLLGEIVFSKEYPEDDFALRQIKKLIAAGHRIRIYVERIEAELNGAQ